MRNKLTLVVSLLAACVGLYHASEWWERKFATVVHSVTSPDGCMRIDTYKPFWLMPSMFHISPDPDPTAQGKFLRSWESAIFRRAYEIRTGDILGETVVFDPVGPAPLIYWGETDKPGRRVVFANQFSLADTTRCSDVVTLAKLQAFYDQERESNRLLQAKRDEDRKATVQHDATGE